MLWRVEKPAAERRCAWPNDKNSLWSGLNIQEKVIVCQGNLSRFGDKLFAFRKTDFQAWDRKAAQPIVGGFSFQKLRLRATLGRNAKSPERNIAQEALNNHKTGGRSDHALIKPSSEN